MKLINLTPHAIIFPTDLGNYTLQPSGEVARMECHYNAHRIVETDEGHRIPMETVRFGAIVGLPEPKPNTLYIVLSDVAQRANRRDVVCPGRSFRYVDDNVIDCEGLLVPETTLNIHSDSRTAEILRMDAHGMRQKDIATALDITPQAVSDALKRHKRNTTFTDAELCLIVDALENPIINQQTHGIPYQFYIAINVVDAITLKGLDEKWAVDPEALLKKLDKLTENDAKQLHMRIEAFWDAAPHADNIVGIREAGL